MSPMKFSTKFHSAVLSVKGSFNIEVYMCSHKYIYRIVVKCGFETNDRRHYKDIVYLGLEKSEEGSNTTADYNCNYAYLFCAYHRIHH
jgi:hypothetical protein